MANYDDRLGDYVDVPARIAEFRSKHPEGSLQPWDPSHPFTVQTIGDRVYIVVVAAAYRSPDDLRPGIGMAYEQWPGKTPYTRDSELQNAETSAWGRAIVAALAADTKKGVASAEEVRNRKADREPQWDAEQQAALVSLWTETIAQAADEKALVAIALRLQAMTKSGELSPPSTDHLVRTHAARRAELNGGS